MGLYSTISISTLMERFVDFFSFDTLLFWLINCYIFLFQYCQKHCTCRAQRIRGNGVLSKELCPTGLISPLFKVGKGRHKLKLADETVLLHGYDLAQWFSKTKDMVIDLRKTLLSPFQTIQRIKDQRTRSGNCTELQVTARN